VFLAVRLFWLDELVPNLDGIYHSEEPVHSIPLSNRTQEWALGTSPFHSIPPSFQTKHTLSVYPRPGAKIVAILYTHDSRFASLWDSTRKKKHGLLLKPVANISIFGGFFTRGVGVETCAVCMPWTLAGRRHTICMICHQRLDRDLHVPGSTSATHVYTSR
jgi:hypothetical protein